MNNYDYSFTQSRELSWLNFNERVLDESKDSAVPLLERLKFVSIFSSNLDEFYMVRVGSIQDLDLIVPSHIDNKTGWTPKEQLQNIFKATLPLYKKKDKRYYEIIEELKEHNITHKSISDLTKAEHRFLQAFFNQKIQPFLSPQIIDVSHPFPHISNKSLNIALLLKNGSNLVFGIVPIPNEIERIVYLSKNEIKFVLCEDVIIEFAQKLFENYIVLEKAIISVTRNADINADDETFDEENDYRLIMKRLLKKRKRLAPVRLEVIGENNSETIDFLSKRLNLSDKQIFNSKSPLETSFVFSLFDKASDSQKNSLCYKKHTPSFSNEIIANQSIAKQIFKKDILLHFPYQSMKPFLKLLKEVANSKNTISIKITIYRLASSAKIIEYLCEAAENGIEVTVLMELRARFDEQNNIDWSNRLEDAGCNIIYGLEAYKVHSKICLITQKQKNKIIYITQIGTGNYNEKTAKLYTDFSLITSNEEIGIDATNFFKNIQISNLEATYKHFLVAPNSLKNNIISLIDKEIEKAKYGLSASIFMKINSLSELDLITKLSEASCAGVKITLIVRGICCLLPQIKEKTENIKIISIVGKYLEHHRIFRFGEKNDYDLYISSADIMTRNLTRRVEIVCPILDESIKQQINQAIEIMLKDNVKARLIDKKGNYQKIKSVEISTNSQEYFEKNANNAKNNVFKLFKRWW
jgi:polyphosphate kinase